MARICAAPRTAALIAILALGGCGDTFLPSYGPRSVDVRTHSTEPDALPYATVRLTPEVVDILASHDPRLANVFADRRPPAALRFGVGDTVSVTIFEAAAGGLFIPIEAGVRPGNFITLPNQRVDNRGNITVPYAGSIRLQVVRPRRSKTPLWLHSRTERSNRRPSSHSPTSGPR